MKSSPAQQRLALQSACFDFCHFNSAASEPCGRQEPHDQAPFSKEPKPMTSALPSGQCIIRGPVITHRRTPRPLPLQVPGSLIISSAAPD
ncbi:hypothetical protein N658DRAFT_180149 [Parathielavia hyrcaniae]|uniref:Uncharacterized protein n=1 Tax=Parathielavia hyrcaniae TaxID=113614 RepID=A0AAN6T590_9PEZI|nr:hypothetical protein N658DRAFT_180149 [Parathielavia hyrcaniae]